MKKYDLIKQDILEAVRSKTLRQGDKIPSCSKLQAQYGVSAVTVRKALADLIQDGILYAVQGRGTFVKEQRILWRTTSGRFSSNIKSEVSRAERQDTEIIELSTLKDKTIAAIFGVSPDAPFTVFKRVRTSDGEPTAYSISYLPLDILDERDYFELRRYKSLYKTLNAKHVIPATTREAFTMEIVSNKEIYTLLQQSNNTPLLYGERLNYDTSGRLFEYTRNYLLANRYTVVCWHSNTHGSGISDPEAEAPFIHINLSKENDDE